MLPVICFSCGELLGDRQNDIDALRTRIVQDKLTQEQVSAHLKTLCEGLSRCCILRILTSMDTFAGIFSYEEYLRSIMGRSAEGV
jgi:DNA-directed RNA polymerase subunit N (RpoN/RPB10)